MTVAARSKSHPLTPALSPRGARGKGSRSSCFSKPEFDSIFQVGVTRENTSVSPLSLRERVRVRGFSDRQINPEGIHPPITAHKHIAAMHQRNRLDDRQPQPMIVAAVAARRIDPIKALEQPRQMLAGNRRSRGWPRRCSPDAPQPRCRTSITCPGAVCCTALLSRLISARRRCAISICTCASPLTCT